MSLLNTNTMRLVKTGPALAERVGRTIAGQHHKAVVGRLRRFRRRLERETAPECWATLELSAALLLADVCAALGLDEAERSDVLGQVGMEALADELEVRPELLPLAHLNARQIEALDCAERYGSITLRIYRALCPTWSDETLRLDLADLVRRGLLIRHGRNKGTRYVLPQPGRTL